MRLIYLFFGLLILSTTTAHAGPTLQSTLERGYVRCGIGETTHLGFTFQNTKGHIEGFDIDFCRVVAAALFGDPGRVDFSVVSNEKRLTLLEAGEYDVLYRTTTWTLMRDAGTELDFAGVNMYDGQGFMVHADSGVKTLADMGKANVCVNADTTTHKNLEDYIKLHNKPWTIELGSNEDILKNNFFTRKCDAYTDDRSGLASIRASDAPLPERIRILPDTISKEPLGAVVRNDDSEWFDVVKWSLLATIEAEELGLNSTNIDAARASSAPALMRFTGQTSDFGDALGLPQDWAYNVIKHVGNYGEIFERNVGEQTALGLSRGLNNLWTKGGLMYAPPFR